MRRLFIAIVCLTLLPAGASALGLGQLEVHSRLNQRLNARIQLHASGQENLADVKVTLADQAAFNRAGVTRTFILTQLRFTIVQNADGVGYIEVTSKERIREPSLSFIIEVNAKAGRLLREYTVLLETAG